MLCLSMHGDLATFHLSRVIGLRLYVMIDVLDPAPALTWTHVLSQSTPETDVIARVQD
jgi:hypothetical protein